MTINNLASDGLHSHMIILARALFKQGPLAKEELVSMCSPPSVETGKDPDLTRLRAAMARWIELGLFSDDAGVVRLTEERLRGETLETWTDRLPARCRYLILQSEHCLPIWGALGSEKTEEGAARAADFARALSWVLAQDIYALPNSDIEHLERTQVPSPHFIFMNDSRWPGMRVWARYLGFATGDDNSFFLDPTEAVRGELAHVLPSQQAVPADAFIDALATRLPVLDRGQYRRQVEEILRSENWRRTPAEHLSMSLSLALRRLELNGNIALEKRADAGTALTLTGRAYRTWSSFTHVRFLGDAN